VPKSNRSQLRGEKLLKRIQAVIRELYVHSSKSGKLYVYNATIVSKEVPTTRRTLARYDKEIDKLLSELNAGRRTSNGEATIEVLRDKVEDLNEKLEEKDKVISALRNHHLNLFKILHINSVNGKELIRPVLNQESKEYGACLMCGSELNSLDKKANVVGIEGKPYSQD